MHFFSGPDYQINCAQNSQYADKKKHYAARVVNVQRAETLKSRLPNLNKIYIL